MNNDEESSYVVCNRFVKMVRRYVEGDKMLNFLYKVPLITRVKTTNSKVGRKYASYEQVS